MARIEWRPLADADLSAIRHFIARDDRARAASFGAQLRRKVKVLAEHPELGRLLGPGVPEGVRVLVLHENYLAYYRIVGPADDPVVQILRVKHAAQLRP